MEIMPNKLTPKKVVSILNTPIGSKYKINTKLSIDKDTGEKIAEPGDKFDLDADIQSYAASTDIVSIIQRLQAGDTSVINVKGNGFDGDLVGMPKDILEYSALNATAKAGFDNLPNDIKALFNNDPATFFNAVIENKVDSILATYKPEEVVIKAENEGGKE